METYFNIRYEMDKQVVWRAIDEQLQQGNPGYICVADGVILNIVHRDPDYRKVVDGSMFSICDSSYVPLYLRWIYGIRREQYCGSQIFMDIIRQKKYRMFFMGTSTQVLNALKQNLTIIDERVQGMTFYELPFCTVDGFDYEDIARQVEADGADIIWVALGAPKQEIFMSRLKPHLKRGVMIAVGAAFKFYSGLDEKRAPQWMLRMHLEFLFRIYSSPRKQLRRCAWIMYSLPGLLHQEWKRKQARNKKLYNMEKQKTALITGITGQDGSYLAEFLLEKGYDVHGTIRRSSVDYRERIAHLEGHPNFHLHYADLGDSMSILQVVKKVKPNEIYNLAAQSHVQVSFDSPEFTADVDATGVLRILEAVRQCDLAETCRIYQASTSELYGKVEEVPQNEQTPFHPYSPYAVAKLYGYWIVKEYREAYNMFCCSGILFNHESERRGETFVTRKITLAAARIAQGKQEKLYLGNLSSLRDWGYAKDYVECMWLILQNDKPEDFVIATGEQHSVREFCQLAFRHVGIELRFEGEGEHEKGIDTKTGKVLVEVSSDFYRPTDVVNLWGNPSKARRELGWNPQKTTFEQLVKLMVEADMAKVAVERAGEHVRTNLAEYLEKGIVK